MEPQYYLFRPSNFLRHSSVDSLLGRIVRNYGDPTSEYCPSESTHIEKDSIIHNSIQNFQLKGLRSKSHGPRINLEGVLGLEYSLERSYKLDLNGEKLISIRLQQHSDLLRRMMENASVRAEVVSWTKKSIFSGPPVCMVVGLLLCRSSEISTIEEKSHNIRVSGLLPIATGGLAAIGAPLAAPLGDITIGEGHAATAKAGWTGSVDELVIIGQQLRVVRRCTWRNEVKLKLRGPRDRRGQQLSASDDEAEDSDEGDSDNQERDLDEVDMDLGGCLLNIQ